MTGQETRNKLTNYWASHDIEKSKEFAIENFLPPPKRMAKTLPKK